MAPNLWLPNGTHVHQGPQPSLELEERVRKVLKGLDELLDIQWIPVAVWNDKWSRAEGRYAITCRWPQGDRRWAMEHHGEPFDILCWACKDLAKADSVPMTPDELEGRVLEFLYKCDNTRESWKVRMAQTIERNKKVKQGAKDEMLDLAHDEFGYYQKKIAGEHFVPGANLTKEN